MPVLVRFVGRFAADAHKHQHDDICDKVGQRVHRIGNHCRTMSHNARHKLKQQEHHIHGATNHRYLIYLFISFHCSAKVVN